MSQTQLFSTPSRRLSSTSKSVSCLWFLVCGLGWTFTRTLAVGLLLQVLIHDISTTVKPSSSAPTVVVVQALKWPRFSAKDKARPTTASWCNGMDFSQDSHADSNEHDNVLSSLQSEPLLQVPCSVRLILESDNDNQDDANDDENDDDHVDNDGNNHSHNQQHDEHHPSIPIATFLDTGAQRTCMSWAALERLRLTHLLDRRYAGQATGLGLCRVLGRIPAQTLVLQFYYNDGNGEFLEVKFKAPAITILESTGLLPNIELLLGLDFLRETHAIIDLQDESLQLHQPSTVHTNNNNHSPSDRHKQKKGKHSQENRIIVPFIRPRGSSSSSTQRESDTAGVHQRKASETAGFEEEDDDSGGEEESDWDDATATSTTGRMDMRGL